MSKKLFSVLLLASLLATSCGSGATSGSDTSVSGDTTTTAPVETEISDDLGTYDFGGDEFHILTRSYPMFNAALNVEEQTGDALDDAIWKRNRNLEERFNFELNETIYQYSVEGNEYPRQFILAADTTYDMYVGKVINFFNFASEGLIRPVTELEQIDPTKPYWNQQLYSDLTIAGQHKFVIGDFNLSAMDYTHVMLFNKQMVKDYKIEDLYSLVRDGKWTYDKFVEIGQTVVEDLNGDSVMDENDQYGYTSVAKQVLPSFWIAGRTQLVVKDEDGLLQYVADSSSDVVDTLTHIFEMTWDTGIYHQNKSDNNTGEDAELEIFKNGKSLFTGSTVFQITSMMRDSQVEFGIIPYPMRDENQDGYYSRIEGTELFGVPYCNENTEMAAVILEALACESLKIVRPAYYDVTLKVKGTRDDESAEMLDIIFENRVFDYADTILTSEVRDGVLQDAMKNNKRDLVSMFAKLRTQCEKKLNTYNEGFAETAE
ncbi:MAG: extracellular solute-binding protein [Ruminococcaceae bacterium]|nr:extracellular solute-binding protein [Oscillospiraceae bacterium]